MTAIKDFVENIENEIPGFDSYPSLTDLIAILLLAFIAVIESMT